MAQPSFYSNAVTPLPSDTELTTWKKILGVLQNLSGSLPNNNPLPSDTLKKTKAKVNAARAGTTVSTNVSL